MKKIVEDAIKEYNRYHSPEANAELVALDDKSFEIKFTGRSAMPVDSTTISTTVKYY